MKRSSNAKVIKLYDDSWLQSPSPTNNKSNPNSESFHKVSCCEKCSSRFTLIVRKHKCRSCNKQVCGKCSSIETILLTSPPKNTTTAELSKCKNPRKRLCGECKEAHEMAATENGLFLSSSRYGSRRNSLDGGFSSRHNSIGGGEGSVYGGKENFGDENENDENIRASSPTPVPPSSHPLKPSSSSLMSPSRGTDAIKSRSISPATRSPLMERSVSNTLNDGSSTSTSVVVSIQLPKSEVETDNANALTLSEDMVFTIQSPSPISPVPNSTSCFTPNLSTTSVGEATFKALKIMVVGPPGEGQATQCCGIQETLGTVYLTIQDIIYSAVMVDKTHLGMHAKALLDEGMKTVLPDELLTALIFERLHQEDCVINGWLLNNYPTTAKQAIQLTNAGVVPDCLILMDATEDVLLDRAMVANNNGEVEEIKVVYQTFQNNINDILSHYDSKLWPLIVNVNQSVEDIQHEILSALKTIQIIPNAVTPAPNNTHHHHHSPPVYEAIARVRMPTDEIIALIDRKIQNASASASSSTTGEAAEINHIDNTTPTQGSPIHNHNKHHYYCTAPPPTPASPTDSIPSPRTLLPAAVNNCGNRRSTKVAAMLSQSTIAMLTLREDEDTYNDEEEIGKENKVTTTESNKNKSTTTSPSKDSIPPPRSAACANIHNNKNNHHIRQEVLLQQEEDGNSDNNDVFNTSGVLLSSPNAVYRNGNNISYDGSINNNDNDNDEGESSSVYKSGGSSDGVTVAHPAPLEDSDDDIDDDNINDTWRSTSEHSPLLVEKVVVENCNDNDDDDVDSELNESNTKIHHSDDNIIFNTNDDDSISLPESISHSVIESVKDTSSYNHYDEIDDTNEDITNNNNMDYSSPQSPISTASTTSVYYISHKKSVLSPDTISFQTNEPLSAVSSNVEDLVNNDASFFTTTLIDSFSSSNIIIASPIRTQQQQSMSSFDSPNQHQLFQSFVSSPSRTSSPGGLSLVHEYDDEEEDELVLQGSRKVQNSNKNNIIMMDMNSSGIFTYSPSLSPVTSIVNFSPVAFSVSSTSGDDNNNSNKRLSTDSATESMKQHSMTSFDSGSKKVNSSASVLDTTTDSIAFRSPFSALTPYKPLLKDRAIEYDLNDFLNTTVDADENSSDSYQQHVSLIEPFNKLLALRSTNRHHHSETNVTLSLIRIIKAVVITVILNFVWTASQVQHTATTHYLRTVSDASALITTENTSNNIRIKNGAVQLMTRTYLVSITAQKYYTIPTAEDFTSAVSMKNYGMATRRKGVYQQLAGFLKDADKAIMENTDY